MEEHSWSWKVSFVGVRILALYLVIHAIITAGQDAFQLSTTIGQIRLWVAIALIGMALIGGALWVWSEAIADRIALHGADQQGEPHPLGLDGRTVLWIALGVIGVVIAVDGLVAIISVTGELVDTSVAFGPQVNPAYWFLGAAVLRTLIGLGLIAKALQVVA